MKNIPEKMKAINLKKPGAAENMVLQETAIPKTGRADVPVSYTHLTLPTTPYV